MSEIPAGEPTSSVEAVPLRTRRIVAGAAAATATVEWYEFFVFSVAAALVFGSLFFPEFSPVAGVLASFATFAVGFLARPLGGVVGGHLGDKYGRKPVLVWALVAMGVATTLIGLLPSYSAIGVAAPVALVVLRLVQGIAVGMQWGGAALLATEYAPPGRRGLYGSMVQMASRSAWSWPTPCSSRSASPPATRPSWPGGGGSPSCSAHWCWCWPG